MSRNSGSRILFAILLFIFVAGVFITGVTVVGIRIEEQSRQNQLHIDCLVTFFTQTNPAQCVEVRQELVDNGILPQEVQDALEEQAPIIAPPVAPVEPGAQGEQGEPGDTPPPLPPLPSLPPLPAIPGEPGEDGADGANGADGVNGADGMDGVSIQGEQGEQGPAVASFTAVIPGLLGPTTVTCTDPDLDLHYTCQEVPPP